MAQNKRFTIANCYSLLLLLLLIRTGALSARLVRLVQEAKVNKTRGIIKSLKDSFGFIERADIVQDVSYCIYFLFFYFFIFLFRYFFTTVKLIKAKTLNLFWVHQLSLSFKTDKESM